MRLSQLLEVDETDPLVRLEKIMKLRATASHVSQENAEACFNWLKSNGYRWMFETSKDGKSFLHIVSSSFKRPNWQNAPGRGERTAARRQLKQYGYSVAPYRANALKQDESSYYYGPHVYFW